MLRGFRWQLIALVLSLFVFAAALVFRLTQTPPPPISTPTTAAIQPSATATQVPTATVTPIPPTQAVAESVISVPLQTSSTYSEALIGQVQRLNPLFADLNPVDRDITSLIFEGLIRINEYSEPVPHLASEWILSNNGLEYVMVLREDVLWQDGIPFSADDVVFTMSLLSSPNFPGSEELGAFWRTVEVEKLGSHLVRFRLAQPLGSFLKNLSIGILPQHALAGTSAAQLATHPFNLSPIGTGPYQLEALRTTSGLIDMVDLQAAPVYRQREEGQAGYAIDRVRFRMYGSFDDAFNGLQAGEVDGLAARNWDERLRLIDLPGMNVYTQTAPELGVLIFNWDEGEGTRFFQERRVRIALQTGVERSGIIQRHFSNLAVQADSPILLNSWAYSPDLPWNDYNPSLAASSILEANIRFDSGESSEDTAPDPEAEPTPLPTATPQGDPLYSFTILVPDSPPLVGAAGEIAAQWSQYSLNVTVEAVDPQTFQSRIENGEFQTAIVELPLGADPDVYAFWHQDQYPDGLNYGGATDDILSELLERARRDNSGINRAQLYARFQRDFIARAIAIPLYYPLYTYVVRDTFDGIQLGFIGSPADRLRNIAEWQLAPTS